MKFSIKGGSLRDDSGRKIARFTKVEGTVDDEWLAETLVNLGAGGLQGVVSVVERPDGETLRVGGSGGRVDSADVDRVWAFYVEAMSPRRKQPGEDDRRVIRDALKVATADECCRAILGCSKSDFHMGKNDKGRKYNKLTQVLKGRRGRETTRERIDFFLDLLEQHARGSSRNPSGDPGVVQRHKQVVQRGWRFRDDPSAVREAEEAQAWLRQHGIETVRREADGYPTFRALRDES